MEAFSIPDELLDEIGLDVPTLANWRGLDEYDKQCDEFIDTLKKYILTLEVRPKHTGKILSLPFADGYAQYMFVDCKEYGKYLLHLPLGDAYHDPLVYNLSVREVLKRIK